MSYQTVYVHINDDQGNIHKVWEVDFRIEEEFHSMTSEQPAHGYVDVIATKIPKDLPEGLIEHCRDAALAQHLKETRS